MKIADSAKPFICIFSLTLAACAQQPVQPQAAAPDEQTEQPAAPQPKPRVVVRPPAVKPPVLPQVALTQPVLFKLLLAEIALDRKSTRLNSSH